MGAATMPPIDFHAVVLSFSFTLPFSRISRSLPLTNIDKTYHRCRRCRCSSGGMPFPPEAIYFFLFHFHSVRAIFPCHVCFLLMLHRPRAPPQLKFHYIDHSMQL